MGLGRRGRRGWRLHPSRAGGRLGAGRDAGISVGLLGTAGVRVLAHGCSQHHAGRDRPGLTARARAGRAVRGTGAHWPGSPCLVPSSFSVARGGDARGGEETGPAAPPPPPPAPRARPGGGGGQRTRFAFWGCSAPGWSGELLPAAPGSASQRKRGVRRPRPPLPGPEPGARRCGTPREQATRAPASGPPRRSRFCRDAGSSRRPRGLRCPAPLLPSPTE